MIKPQIKQLRLLNEVRQYCDLKIYGIIPNVKISIIREIFSDNIELYLSFCLLQFHEKTIFEFMKHLYFCLKNQSYYHLPYGENLIDRAIQELLSITELFCIENNLLHNDFVTNNKV